MQTLSAKNPASATSTFRVIWPIFVVHLVLVLAAGALWQHYFGTTARYIRPERFGVFIAGLSHWDATWFLRIAKYGYAAANPNSAAFFPLYPAAMGIVGRLVSVIAHAGVSGPAGDKAYLFAGIVVSNLSFLVGLACIYRVARRHLRHGQALRGLWLLALFPSSYYLSAAYSESMFMMLIAAGLLLGYRQRFVWAGVCIGLAVLCRNLGPFAVPSLLWLVWRDFQIHRRVARAVWNAVAVSFIPAACLGLYLAWLNHVYHNPLVFLWAERHHWNRHFTWIWTSLHLDYQRDPLGFLAAALFLILLVVSIRSIPFEQWLFCAFALIIPLFSTGGVHPYPMSMIRFVTVLFPIYLYVGAAMRRLETYMAVIASSTVLLVLLTGLFASGRWVA